MNTPTSEFEILLTGMAHGGNAVGRFEGKAIFVPFGIAGERVRVRLVQDKGRYAIARLVEVLEPAPSRRAPRCIHFGDCGGCHWQHIDYAAQLEFKRQIVADQLARIGGLKDVPVHPVIPSPEAWHYRTHTTLHGQGEYVGFVEFDNETILAIQECHIIRPELMAMINELPEALLGARRVRLQIGSEGGSRLVTTLKAPANDVDEDSTSLTGGSDTVLYTLKGHTFQVTGGSFFQVNFPQAEALVDLLMAKIDPALREGALDLYCGVGLFTRFLAQKFRRVLAIESSFAAVQDARANLGDLSHVEVIEGKAEIVLARQKRRIDLAVTDPPRTGMKPAALDALLNLQPYQILYISCDPATLARDAKRIVEGGYRLVEVQPVDMFPHTFHIESVATFLSL